MEIKSIELALDPKNIPSFLLDWEVTKRCNLDCSYCATGIDGGHDNSTEHPLLAECLESIDFMFAYVDKYMRYKKLNQRKVILNIYGGESLFHPDIVEILHQVKQRYQPYKDNWYLTVSCTTNAIVGEKQWANIVPLIDNFTISYHSENLLKQKEIFKTNALSLQSSGKPFKTIVMMHNDPVHWGDCMSMIEFLKNNNIDYVAKPMDNTGTKWAYSQEQFKKLKTFWINKTSSQKETYERQLSKVSSGECVSSIETGRACCGGRKLSTNGDLKSSMAFVPRQGFTDWYCSVNWFFLFVRQFDGNVFTNKDCKTNLDSQIGPIGNLRDTQSILKTLDSQLIDKAMPVIKCIKSLCMCGFCAPKAELKTDFDDLMRRHIIDNTTKNS
jgi:sulfatase maturation enzyme AslB (radical SAM superfamily)